MLKNTIKISKQSKTINYQPKTFENPNNVDTKSVITEHPNTLHKLSKTIRQVEKACSLYIVIQKSNNFLNEKNVKIKQAHDFKGYASTYNVEVLNSINPELQLKDPESKIKSKLIDL